VCITREKSLCVRVWRGSSGVAVEVAVCASMRKPAEGFLQGMRHTSGHINYLDCYIRDCYTRMVWRKRTIIRVIRVMRNRENDQGGKNGNRRRIPSANLNLLSLYAVSSAEHKGLTNLITNNIGPNHS
jgi:hypothetical protein